MKLLSEVKKLKTIALRFSDNYAPKEGMIFLHQELINNLGYVWYGKFGNKISKEIIEEQLKKGQLVEIKQINYQSLEMLGLFNIKAQILRLQAKN